MVLTYHAGQALLGGVVLGLIEGAGKRRFALSLALIFAGSLSDPFFVIGFSAAIMLAALADIPGLRTQVMRAACVAAAVLSGLATRQLLPLPPQQTGLLSWSRTLESFSILTRTAMEPRGQLTIVFWVLAGLTALGVWRLARGQRALVRWTVVGACAVAGAIAIGAPTAFPDSRYLTAHSIALAAVASISLARLLPTPRIWLLLAGAALLHSGVTAFNSWAHVRNIGHTRNKFVECFQTFRQEAARPVSRCVAGYWAAKPVSLFAEPPVVALQVKPNGTPDWFISTRRHFQDRAFVDCAIFPANEVGHFTARFGPPTIQKQCDSVVVLGYFDAERARLNEALQPVLAQPAVPSPFF